MLRQRTNIPFGQVLPSLPNKNALTNNFLAHEDVYTFMNKKVLLLYGPPGGGKSTLAKVLAKHCGYKSIEINASDERTGEKLLEKIQNATSMNMHFNKDQE